MNSDITPVDARKAELLQAFLKQVPGRIDAILENWQQLVQQHWAAEQLTRLLQRLHTLTEASGKFGIPRLEASGQSLLEHLSSFGDGTPGPRQQDLVTLDGLIHAFREAALEACRRPEQEARPKLPGGESEATRAHPGEILLLGLDQTTATGLEKALRATGYQVGRVTDSESVFTRLRADNPSNRALIAHVDWLQALYPTSRHGALWQDEGGLPGLPVAFIADTNDLRVRLDAMRTDAKAYWVRPLVYEEVAERMQALTSPKSQAPYRILIVEDDPAQADFASAILSKAAFQCRSVIEPLQVLEVLHAFRPDLILMDLYMPEVSGSELTAVIREQPRFLDTPIVFLSGEQDPDKKLTALSCGGEDFLSKPVAPRHLIKTVTHRIRRARQLAQRTGGPGQRQPATGLHSREVLFERLESLLRESSADGRHAVLYLEMDNAEAVLNKLGIGVMDTLINSIADRLRAQLKPGDILSRYGEHSLGLVIGGDSRVSLEAFGQQLCTTVAAEAIEVENHRVSVTLSIGACAVDGSSRDPLALFSRAKAAANAARKSGGNRINVQSPAATQCIGTQDRSLADLIRQAIKEHYFEIYFQPIVDLKGASEEAYYQALIRLQEPDGRLLTAADFIPQAEQLGVIGQLDQWTTRNAISMIHQHRQQGQALHLFVSQAIDLVDNLERLSWLREKHRRGLIVERTLTFEFRLDEVAKKLDSAKLCFEMLVGMGISLLLTGVNHSTESERLLRQLPLAYIKPAVDLLQAPDKGLTNLISLSHSLKIKVIAPRVEDPRSIALLWSSGVDHVQGNFVQRPENNLLYDFNESVLN